MKSANKLKQWLMLMLCTVMAFGILTQTAVASPPQATGKCTNAFTEGIEYFVPFTGIGDNAEAWRGDLLVSVLDAKKLAQKEEVSVGKVIGLEIEAVNDNIRYQCTQLIEGVPGTHFSCNSFPTNAIINGIYFLYSPTVSENTEITFVVENEFAATESSKTLYKDSTYVKMPPYPCARNTFLTRNFIAPYGSSLVYPINCSDTSKKTIEFIEQVDQYAIVNITNLENSLESDRFHIEVSPMQMFDYRLELDFVDYNGETYTIPYIYDYDPITKTGTGIVKFVHADGTPDIITPEKIYNLKTKDLPLTLEGGRITGIKAEEENGWGEKVYPTSAEMLVRFYYENYTGTIGYENSVFHFERNLNLLFTPYCEQTANAVAMYDPCKEATQVFETVLPKPIEIAAGDQIRCRTNVATQTKCDVRNTDIEPTYPEGIYGDGVFFYTRKCVDAACTTVKYTDAYPYAIRVSDGARSSWTYTRNGVWSEKGIGTAATFTMKPFGTSAKPFTITATNRVLIKFTLSRNMMSAMMLFRRITIPNSMSPWARPMNRSTASPGRITVISLPIGMNVSRTAKPSLSPLRSSKDKMPGSKTAPQSRLITTTIQKNPTCRKNWKSPVWFVNLRQFPRQDALRTVTATIMRSMCRLIPEYGLPAVRFTWKVIRNMMTTMLPICVRIR